MMNTFNRHGDVDRLDGSIISSLYCSHQHRVRSDAPWCRLDCTYKYGEETVLRWSIRLDCTYKYGEETVLRWSMWLGVDL
jgi:hypothetical protein